MCHLHNSMLFSFSIEISLHRVGTHDFNMITTLNGTINGWLQKSTKKWLEMERKDPLAIELNKTYCYIIPSGVDLLMYSLIAVLQCCKIDPLERRKQERGIGEAYHSHRQWHRKMLGDRGAGWARAAKVGSGPRTGEALKISCLFSSVKKQLP